MRFEPKTEQQVQEEGLVPAGVYDFEIVAAEDKLSSKGNEMTVVTLNVIGPDGEGHKVTDYLLEAMAYKLRHFAYGTKLNADYEKGVLTADSMIGRTGQCKVVIDPAKGQYRAKNTVADYITPNGEGAAVRAQAPVGRDPRPPVPDLDDEIPF